MQNKTFLLLGGYGEVGRVLARLLLKETNVNIVIAGRRKEKASEFAALLNGEFFGERVSSCFADASNRESLQKAFDGVQMVIVLATTPDCIKLIAETALAANADYLDILVSDSTLRDLEGLSSKIGEQKRTFITQAGFHPGLPAVFVRYASKYFDVYKKARVAMAMNARFERPEQGAEIIPLIAESRAEICVGGVWKKATYKDAITIDMGDLFGKKTVFPMEMFEMKSVQKQFALQSAGVYVAGFNWFVDYVVFPIIFITQKIKKGFAFHAMLRFFAWAVNTFSSPGKGVVFLNDAEGLKDGKPLRVRIVAEHDDAYLVTAIPVVACLKQYLEGELSTGVGMMGLIVDENRLVEDMKKMGVKISILFNL